MVIGLIFLWTCSALGQERASKSQPTSEELHKAKSLAFTLMTASFRAIAAEDVLRLSTNFLIGTNFNVLLDRPLVRKSPEFLSCFFSTTVLLTRELRDGWAAVFYNPYSDTAILTKWKILEKQAPRLMFTTVEFGTCPEFS